MFVIRYAIAEDAEKEDWQSLCIGQEEASCKA